MAVDFVGCVTLGFIELAGWVPLAVVWAELAGTVGVVPGCELVVVDFTGCVTLGLAELTGLEPVAVV